VPGKSRRLCGRDQAIPSDRLCGGRTFLRAEFADGIDDGEARGACLVAAAEAGLEIYEIATRKVKQPWSATVGAKARGRQNGQRLLNLPNARARRLDASRAALTHAGKTAVTLLARQKNLKKSDHLPPWQTH
jgi:Holliday junction resolvasome RuvABC endonuclease subunit